jgi:hypothetical protein
VIVYKHDGWYSDAVMVPNQQRYDDINNLYFTSAYPADPLQNCGTGYIHQFYMISSLYDGTEINVRQQDGTAFDVTLPEFGSFLQMTNNATNNLASGTRISASMPITVISGTMCVLNPLGAGTYASNVPEVAALGNTYVAPMITSGESYAAGYSIAVVATEPGTRVESDGNAVEVLDEGEMAVFEYDGLNRSVVVDCSKRCLVTQYAKSGDDVIGMFMLHVLPAFEFGTYAFFKTFDLLPPTYLTIVLYGEEPGVNMYINGVSLRDKPWNPLAGNTWLEIELQEGIQEVVSTDGRRFAAYVYNHGPIDRGSGYTYLTEGVGPWETTAAPIVTTEEGEMTTEGGEVTTEGGEVTTEGGEMTTEGGEMTTEGGEMTTEGGEMTTEGGEVTTEGEEVTRPPTNTPAPSAGYPQHTARVNGTARATDGQAISPQCAMVSRK